MTALDRRTLRHRVLGVAAGLGLLVATRGPAQSQDAMPDPFAFLSPSVRVSAAERRRLDRGEVVARTLPSGDGQVGVLVAARVQAAPEALATWTRAIDQFKRSQYVLAISRFSDPPVLADLDALTLDAADVADVLHCRPGDCDLKLMAREMAALRFATRTAGGSRDAAERAFRQIVLDRVHAYRTGGMAALPPLADHARQRRIGDALASILDHSPYLARLPAVAEWVRQFPQASGPEESFLYWSKESYGRGKPVVSVTHVGIVRPAPAPDRPVVLVTGTQLLATHYTNASLGLTMMFAASGGGASYLVYLNRTEVDIIGGLFGGVVRSAMEGRLSRQAPLVVRGLRARLESGPPPGGIR